MSERKVPEYEVKTIQFEIQGGSPDEIESLKSRIQDLITNHLEEFKQADEDTEVRLRIFTKRC